MLNLSRLNLSAQNLYPMFVAAHIPIAIITALFAGTPVLAVASGAIAIALLALAGRFVIGGRTGEIVVGVTLMAQIALLVLALTGHPWQVDMHMYFFAGLALLSGYRSQSVVIAAAAAVAAHHVTLNFAASDFVYPGGPSFGRLSMHAIILVLEAVGLIIVIRSVQQNAAAAEERAREAELAHSETERETLALQQTLEDLEAARVSASHAELKAEAERASADADREKARQTQEHVVSALAEALNRLSRGDLTYRINEEFSGRYESLRVDFNNAAVALEEVFSSILGAASTLKSGVEEITSASDKLSGRTERQAATLEESAAALEELTRTIKLTAEHASQTNSVVRSASEDARTSSTVMRQSISAMDAISTSARQIGNITSVIDEIAFQTNLLALNAGVEAARAGEAGMGFAVVATEVRALAQRSADAAREIDNLIKTSTDQVSDGVSLVRQAGEALKRITDKVDEIASLVTEITSSYHEQATGVSQINIAVGEMDKVTQQNAAMVEETTAASHTLLKEVRGLSEMIAQFSVGAGQGGGSDVQSQLRRVEAFARNKAAG